MGGGGRAPVHSLSCPFTSIFRLFPFFLTILYTKCEMEGAFDLTCQKRLLVVPRDSALDISEQIFGSSSFY